MTPEELQAQQSALWLQQNRPDLVNSTNTAEQAAALNAQYIWSNTPAGIAYYQDLRQQEAIQRYQVQQAGDVDARNEYDKHMRAFHPDYYYGPATNYADVPLSQMGARADYVSSYYRDHPSERFTAISGEYAATHNQVVGADGVMYRQPATATNPFDPNTALGIAWEVNRTGGGVDWNLAGIARSEARIAGVDSSWLTVASNIYQERQDKNVKYADGVYLEPIRMNVSYDAALQSIAANSQNRNFFEMGIHTAPGDWGGIYVPGPTVKSADSMPLNISGSKMVAGFDQSGLTTFVPYGEYRQTALENTKLVMDQTTGEIGIYQYDQMHDRWGLIGGGSRAAAQSGMFSVGRALTPWVVTQESGGADFNYKYGNIAEAAGIMATPYSYSRLGAEAYAGFVRPLDNRTLSEQDALSRYGNSWNLANYADPFGVNKGKAEAPGAAIPWSVQKESPFLQFVNSKGLTGEYITSGEFRIPTAPGGATFPVVPNTPVIPFANMTMRQDYGMPAVNMTTGVTSQLGIGLTDTVTARTSQTPWYMNPLGAAMGAATGFYAWATQPIDWNKEMRTAASGPTPAQAISGGGLLGYAAFGEKAPEVIKGAFGSGVDFITGMVGWTPVADRMRTEAPGLQDFRTQKNLYESQLSQMADYGKQQFGTTAEGKIRIDVSNPNAIAWNQKYDSLMSGYDSFMLSARDKGLVTIQGGKMIENPDLTYNYGEFTKWGLGAGETVRKSLGFNKEQLEAYGVQLEQKQGLQYIPEKIVYGAGYTFSTHPEKFVSAYIGGGLMVFGGEVAGGLWQGTGMAARAAAWGAAHPIAAAVTSGAMRYGVPAALLGATYWGASEGLTASPERTTINIGKMTPELAGMMYGAATGYVGLRAMDAGWIGFRNEKKVIDLTNVKFEGGNEFIIRPGDSLLNRGAKTVIGEEAMRGARLTPPDRILFEQTTATQPRRFDFSQAQDRMGAELPPDWFPGVKELMESSDITRPFTRESWNPPSRAADTIATENWIRQIERDATISRNPNPATIQYQERALADAWRPIPESGALPMDFLPGVGREGGLRRMSMPIPEDRMAGLAAEMGVRIELPRGLETRVSGAGMSERMLESLVNPDILPIINKASYGAELDAAIAESSMASRVRPAMNIAEQQRIIPGMGGKIAPKKQFSFDTGEFFDIWSGIAEAERRPASARLPKGTQLDYLRDALGERTGTFWIEDNPQRIGTRAPKTATFMDIAVYDMQRNAPRKRWDTFFRTRDSQDNMNMSGQIWDTRHINDMIRNQPQIDINLPDQFIGQLPGRALGSRARQRLIQQQSPDQKPREMNDRAFDTMIRHVQETRQMRTPETVPFEGVRTREITEPPFVPTTEIPRRPVTEPPFVPTIRIPPVDVPPYVPVPDEPWWPETPPPPPPFIGLPNFGAGGGGGFQGPKGYYRFIERLSYAEGAYSVGLPRTRRASAGKKSSSRPSPSAKRKTTSRRSR